MASMCLMALMAGCGNKNVPNQQGADAGADETQATQEPGAAESSKDYKNGNHAQRNSSQEAPYKARRVYYLPENEAPLKFKVNESVLKLVVNIWVNASVVGPYAAMGTAGTACPNNPCVILTDPSGDATKYEYPVNPSINAASNGGYLIWKALSQQIPAPKAGTWSFAILGYGHNLEAAIVVGGASA